MHFPKTFPLLCLLLWVCAFPLAAKAGSEGIGDACPQIPGFQFWPGPDSDGDGLGNNCDNCPAVSNPKADCDGDSSTAEEQCDLDDDGMGDACDPDDDNDGKADNEDNCILVENQDQTDDDNDGYGNACDGDLNQNGYANPQDYPLFAQDMYMAPQNRNHGADIDSNGIIDFDDWALFTGLHYKPLGPSAYVNSDGDGYADEFDNCPGEYNPDQANNDGRWDDQGDACDDDDDNDGIDDLPDNCPLTWNPKQLDHDGNHIGNACEPDGVRVAERWSF